MKRNIPYFITAITQLVFLFCILLNFLCIWMFTVGVPYTYPLAILGNVLIIFLPIEVICLICNLIFLIKDRKQCSTKQNILKSVYVCASFALLCLLKIILHYYADNLVGVV